MSRMLAVVHGVLALVAFGFGNAALGAVWETPAFLHLLFGVVLVILAFSLWRESALARWVAVLSLLVGLVVAMAAVMGAVDGRSVGVAVLSVAFVALEVATLRATKPFGRGTA